VDGYVVTLDGTSVPADRATAEAALAAGTLLWLDLHGADDDAMAMLREVFRFHPVAMDDVNEFGQRPKAENFGDIVYIVSYAATTVLGPLTEVHAFYSETFLITVRKKGCDALDEVRRQLAVTGGEPSSGTRPPRLIMLHHILDSMIDSFFSPLSDLDDRIDALLEQIFVKPSQDELQDLLGMQRWLVGVRKLVTPQRDVMAALLSGIVMVPGRTADSDPYLRDLYDHVIRISDLIDSYRDLLSSAMDVYLSTVSNRLNAVMKQLTVIATVFLPLTFITGFFGQNFGYLTGHITNWETFVGLGIGIELAALLLLLGYFKRRQWF
jgi:magnesium transporter